MCLNTVKNNFRAKIRRAAEQGRINIDFEGLQSDDQRKNETTDRVRSEFVPTQGY